MQIYLEDQYASCEAHLTLAEIHAKLPSDLGFRAANVPLTLGQLLARGGFGDLQHPLRHEVLGLKYQSDTQDQSEEIAVGGTVVKNVAGYDLTRLVIGMGRDAFVEAHIRLRPMPARKLYRAAIATPNWQSYRLAGWHQAWQADQWVYLQGPVSLLAPAGFVEVAACEPAQVWQDARGAWDLVGHPNPLSERVMAALQLATNSK